MPFQKGNKYGGKRANAGRPSKSKIRTEKTVQQRAREIIEENCGRIFGTYLKLAISGRDPQTTRHAVDKIIPDEQIQQLSSITINFVKFDNTPTASVSVGGQGTNKDIEEAQIVKPGWLNGNE